ncbi:MAG: hypothetical protein V8K32_06180 [Candidatus Electrothrix gigas]
MIALLLRETVGFIWNFCPARSEYPGIRTSRPRSDDTCPMWRKPLGSEGESGDDIAVLAGFEFFGYDLADEVEGFFWGVC